MADKKSCRKVKKLYYIIQTKYLPKRFFVLLLKIVDCYLGNFQLSHLKAFSTKTIIKATLW